IEGEGGSTEMRLVIEAEQRVEAHGTNGQGELLGEERVAEGEQRVDRVPRRAAVAAVEIELERGTTLQHAGELGIVAPCRGAFDAEECLEGLGAARFARELLELRERDGARALVVSAEQGATVQDFGGNEGAREL